MQTLTLKLPEVLEAKLNIFSRKMRKSRSEIVRRAIIQYISYGDKSQSGHFLDLSRDIVGSIGGPADHSSNKANFEGYGK